MTRPQRFLTRMVVFLGAVAAVIAVLAAPVYRAFLANPALNGLIAGVLASGIVYVFRQVVLLRKEVEWIESAKRRDQSIAGIEAPPALLAPVARMLGERDIVSLSAPSSRSILDSVSARLDESRDISRYLIGLLVFLGLLGTFWGLLSTVSSVGDTIGSLTVGSGDVAQIFDDLKAGLEAPLSGMGTAFSSSLFGLAGSLVLGFLDLQAAQAQNRFYNEFEEWLSGMTRLSAGGPALGEGEGSVPGYIGALLEQTADTIEAMQRTVARDQEGRGAVNDALLSLAEKLATLTDQMSAEQRLMAKIAESQASMEPVLERLSAALKAQEGGGLDEASRNHLRNIDVYLQRLLKEAREGREETVGELRAEIKLLSRTLSTRRDDRSQER